MSRSRGSSAAAISRAYRSSGSLPRPPGGVAQLVERLHGMQEVREFDSPRLHQTKARSAGVYAPAASRLESPRKGLVVSLVVSFARQPGRGNPPPVALVAALGG